VAVGSIIAVIITAHIAQSISTCTASHSAVIIQAEGPSIVPYMSRAISAIHVHAASVTAMRTIAMTARSWRSTAHMIQIVGSRSASGMSAASSDGPACTCSREIDNSITCSTASMRTMTSGDTSTVFPPIQLLVSTTM
jgi:hypothetical protein